MTLAEPAAGIHLPPGCHVTIPGRGRAWVWDSGPHASGATVLLLHGWCSTAALTWQSCMGPLAERFRVVAPDLRGHGRGIRSKRNFRLEDCADDIAGLVTALGTGPVIVVGYSMGGPVAQLLWRRHREVVAGLVLCATATTFARTPVSGAVVATAALGLGLIASALPDGVRAAGMRRMARSTYPPGGSPRSEWLAQEWGGADPAGLLGAGAAVLRYDSTEWIGQIDVPTAVIVTETDLTVPPERQSLLAEAIPSAVRLTVSGGHRSCVDDATPFVATLLDACRQVAGSPTATPDGRRH